MTAAHAQRFGMAAAAAILGQPLPAAGSAELTELLMSARHLADADDPTAWTVFGSLVAAALVHRIKSEVDAIAATTDAGGGGRVHH